MNKLNERNFIAVVLIITLKTDNNQSLKTIIIFLRYPRIIKTEISQR